MIQGLCGQNAGELLHAALLHLSEEGPAARVRGRIGGHFFGIPIELVAVGKRPPLLRQVHQFSGVGVHIAVVPAVGEIAQGGGPAVLIQAVLQAHGEQLLEELPRPLGGDVGLPGGYGPDVAAGQIVPPEIHHAVVRRPDLDAHAQRGRYAVEADGPPEIIGGLVQGFPLVLPEHHGLIGGQDLVQEGLSGLLGPVPPSLWEGWILEAPVPILGGVMSEVAEDAAVLPRGDAEAAPIAVPVKVPERGQCVLLRVAAEIAVGVGVQIQGLLYRQGHGAQPRLGAFLRRRRQRQRQQQGQRQYQGQCFFHSDFLLCCFFPSK